MTKDPYREFGDALDALKRALREVYEPPVLWCLDKLTALLNWMGFGNGNDRRQ